MLFHALTGVVVVVVVVVVHVVVVVFVVVAVVVFVVIVVFFLSLSYTSTHRGGTARLLGPMARAVEALFLTQALAGQEGPR